MRVSEWLPLVSEIKTVSPTKNPASDCTTNSCAPSSVAYTRKDITGAAGSVVVVVVELEVDEEVVVVEVNVEVDVDVDEVFGNFALSRNSLFGKLDDKALYKKYHENDQGFMRDLKLALRAKTRAKNILVVKPDSLVSVEGLVSSAVLRFRGGVNAEYRVMAFNGGGTLDRRGKQGGHKNWSFNGYFEREGMYVTFYNQSVVPGVCGWDDCTQSTGL